MTTATRFVLLLFVSACAAPAQRGTQAAPTPEAEAPPPLAPPDRSIPGVAVGTRGAVSSAALDATRVGLDVLRAGGNAVDAAIAVGMALAVTHPSGGNIGGGGFMVVRMADGTATTFDYRETAPAAATTNMYLDDEGEPTGESRIGAKAAGIPGTIAGFALAHERFGTRPWKDLVEPSVKLAGEGHVIDDWHAEDLARAVERMRKAGFEDTAKLYLRPDGQPLAAGDRWLQPELAATLAVVAANPRAFYEGPLATKLAEGVRAKGGLWTVEDLAGYRPVEREPIVFDYYQHQIIAMPPPSAGGVVLRLILGASEKLRIYEEPWRSAEAHHLYVEATRRAYSVRNLLLGDPDFASVPTQQLLAESYGDELMRDIDRKHATPSDEINVREPPAESPETTHYSVVDGHGNAVSNTYTLNSGFGAKLVVPGTGVLLNNEMDDFTSKLGTPNLYGLVQGAKNLIQPGKRMLSSMSPTIIVRDGKLRAVLGSPGGPTITTTVAQITRAIIDYGRPLHEAVRAARVHHQGVPDRVIVEPGTEPAIVDGLKELGHEVVESRWGRIGHANCIEVDPLSGGLRAVADVTRDGGGALAY
jgi:gamma-glutamyltranspeptidase/glutathione hydrolase